MPPMPTVASGGLVTFEVLLDAFDLNEDAGLAGLARLVHDLDVGGSVVAEAASFEGRACRTSRHLGERRHAARGYFTGAGGPLSAFRFANQTGATMNQEHGKALLNINWEAVLKRIGAISTLGDTP
jgi:hypothetical protein